MFVYAYLVIMCCDLSRLEVVLVFPFMPKPSLEAKSTKPISFPVVPLPACSFTNQIPAANFQQQNSNMEFVCNCI